MRKYLAILLLIVAYWADAQVDTDRPAYTNSVNTVPKNALQFEGGVGYNLQVSTQIPFLNRGLYVNRIETISVPQGVFRYGVSSQAEIRLELPQFSSSKYRFSNDSQSRYDTDLWNRQVGVGLKQQILNNEKFTLTNLTTLRSQRDVFSESERELTFGLYNDVIWEYRFNERSKVAGTLGFGNPKDLFYLNYAALFGSKITDKLWLQAEVVSEYYFYENSRSNENFYTLNFSSLYVINERNAIDLTLGSVLLSNTFFLPRNLTVQLGYAQLFKSKHE